MALADVVAALNTDFLARNCKAPILLGAQYLRDHDAPSRIVIVPGTDTFGEKLPSTIPKGLPGQPNPRAIKTRFCTAVANIWAAAPEMREPGAQQAADLAALDALINCFIAALQSTCAGIYGLSSGTYPATQESHTNRGIIYELGFSVAVPVLDIAWPPVAITTCDLTFIPAPAHAEVTVSTLLGDPATQQVGVEYVAPTPDP